MEHHGLIPVFLEMHSFESVDCRLQVSSMSASFHDDARQAQESNVIVLRCSFEVGVTDLIYEKATSHGKQR